ncbi:hypothetical protein BSL78_21850 [Apostichopus japonicus]|uniref:Ig-like domain-containing protein n=1 Tax=Stichopus japonicus TaxID=307972 RepID=A0A2G8JZZ0_STIJA|nr:hypothetical protein BSL78_21850 [Apostichopus japonicus]
MTSNYLLGVAFFIAIALPTSYSGSSLSCPEELSVKEGSTQVVNCSLTTSTLTELYWFVGNSTSSLPIAQLVSGVRHVWPVQHYDISDDGSLIIESVGRNQTGPYTILHFMEDDEKEQDTVFINLIGEPCPMIDQCNSCEDCVIQATEDLILLTCTITSPTTEKISPIWTYNNGSIIQGRIHEERLSDNSWNVSVSLHIQSLKCGLTVLLCSSSIRGHDKTVKDARVNVTFVSCDDLEIPNDGNDPILIVTCVIAIVMIVTTTLLIALYCGRSCNRKTKNEDEVGKEDEDLKEIEPLIDRFLKTQLQIVTPKGERKEMSAASFFNSDVEWKNTKRIIFVGDILTEETPIVKQANSMCSKENYDETLFIVDLKELNFEADFAKEIHKQLPPNSKYSLGEVNDMLSSKCWLILDGGGKPLELPKPPDLEEDVDVDKLTTFDMLCRNENDLLRVWVTSLPSDPSNYFKAYTKIYFPKSNENETQSSITNL